MPGDVVLQIEPTDLCNLRCAMCTPQLHGRDVHRGLPTGFLDRAVLSQVLDDLRDHRFELDHLIFQWLGEPTLHPELEEMVVEAGEKLVGLVDYLRVDTNAVALTPARIDKLLRLLEGVRRGGGRPPLLLVFSLDAVTAETYRQVKGRDRFHQVMVNIDALLRRRGEMEGDDPGINTQFQFVLQPENHGEVGAFVQHWDETLAHGRNGIGFNEVMIKRLSAGTGGPRQRELDALYDRAIERHGLHPRDSGHMHLRVWNERTWGENDPPEDGGNEAADPGAGDEAVRSPCPAPWKTPVIRWDGQLMVCCADVDGAIEVGNVRDDGFVSLWGGPTMTRIRLAHLTGRLGRLPFCQACGGFTYYELSEEQIRTYLERIGRLDLLDIVVPGACVT